MAQASPLRVANRAFVLLGTSQRLSSFDEAGPLGEAVRAIFDESRDEVLAEHPWNFALSYRRLAATAETVETGQWGAAYEVPGDCLRWLPWARDDDEFFDGERIGPYIFADAGLTPLARIIARIEDASRWSPGFGIALAGYLAMQLASSAAVQSDTSAKRAEQIYETALSRGRRQDAQESSTMMRDARARSTWLAAR